MNSLRESFSEPFDAGPMAERVLGNRSLPPLNAKKVRLSLRPKDRLHLFLDDVDQVFIKGKGQFRVGHSSYEYRQKNLTFRGSSGKERGRKKNS